MSNVHYLKLGWIGLCFLLAFSYPAAHAQFASIIGKSAAKAAASAAERQAAGRAVRNSAAQSGVRGAVANIERDYVVKRWSSALCKPASPCPLNEKTANTFNGGSYNETILGSDTVLYRVYHRPDRKFSGSGERYSYWSRSDAKGLQAAIDGAIEVSRYGNMAGRQVMIRVPKGTRIYEGEAHGNYRGTAGGGNQIILEGTKPEWELKSIGNTGISR